MLTNETQRGIKMGYEIVPSLEQLHTISESPQTECWYKLALRDHQAARGREEEAGGMRPMTWGRNFDEE